MKGYEALKILDEGGVVSYGKVILKKSDRRSAHTIDFCPIDMFGTELEEWASWIGTNQDWFSDDYDSVKTIYIIDGKWSHFSFIHDLLSGKEAMYGLVWYKLDEKDGLVCRDSENVFWSKAKLNMAEFVTYTSLKENKK